METSTQLTLLGILATLVVGGGAIYFGRRSLEVTVQQGAERAVAERAAKVEAINAAFAPIIGIVDELIVEANAEANCIVDSNARHNRFAFETADYEVLQKLQARLERLPIEPPGDQEAIRQTARLVRASEIMVDALLTDRKQRSDQGNPELSPAQASQVRSQALRGLPAVDLARNALIARRDTLLADLDAKP